MLLSELMAHAAFPQWLAKYNVKGHNGKDFRNLHFNKKKHWLVGMTAYHMLFV